MVVQEVEMWVQMHQGRHRAMLVVCLLQLQKVGRVVKPLLQDQQKGVK